MPGTFNEAQAEKMVIDACVAAGWQYVQADDLPRDYGDVLVDSMVKAALIRLNPCIAEHPAHADTVIYKLRSLISTVQPHDLITQNERFKKLVFEENSFPFAPDGRSISIRFFDYDDISKNEFVVTNQWVYPYVNGGKRLDIVLLINGFPVIIGEMKSPTRPSISWVDGAQDIGKYEKSIPQMFVTNIFNFASEGKAFRYGSVCAPVTVWGPWFAGIDHAEGTITEVQTSVTSIMKPETVLDLFRYFTLFSTDKRNRKIKVVCRYQQYEGANMIVERVKAGYPKKGLIPRQFSSSIRYMKEQGIIQLERRDSHQKYYKICTEEESKALLNPQAQPVETGGYDQDVLDRVDELVQSNSPKDKRIGGLLLECMARGEVTVDDYAAIGESSKWFGDMQLASQLGLVEKTSPQRYAILRHLKTGALSLSKGQKRFITEMYETFGDDVFSTEMVIATLDYSGAHVSAYLHQFTLLKILDCRKEDVYRYQFLINPEEHPEYFEPAA